MRGHAASLWVLLGLATALCTAAAVWLPASLPAHLFLWLAAGLLWLLSLHVGGLVRGPAGRHTLPVLLFIALLLRLPALLAPPRHSDDVHRYLWDGAVQGAGLSPYAGPPDDAIYNEVRGQVPDAFARINNRALPTIYLPAAQLAFRGGHALGRAVGDPLVGWKLFIGLLDLLLCLALYAFCRDRLAACWAWSPLVAIELWQDGHMDIVGILPLVLALLVLRRRPLVSGVLCGAALLCKPLAAALLPAAWRGRLRPFLAGAVLVVAAGLLLYGGRGPGSLGEYGRRWRANAGAFAVIEHGARFAVERTYAMADIRPWEPWRCGRLARLVTGRDRATVFPDELAGFLARAAVLALLACWLLCLLRRGVSDEALVLSLIGGYLLLTPVLHPWYVLWALPLCALAPRHAGPWLLLALLLPLAYLPLGPYLEGRGWIEPLWSRLLIHGTAWLALLYLQLTACGCAAGAASSGSVLARAGRGACPRRAWSPAPR